MQRLAPKKKKKDRNTISIKEAPRARHPGMLSQAGLRKHHSEQS